MQKPTDEPTDCKVISFGLPDLKGPRIILMTCRGETRPLGQVLVDLLTLLHAGLSTHVSEPLNTQTCVPAGSILQIYCGPPTNLPKRQPPRAP